MARRNIFKILIILLLLSIIMAAVCGCQKVFFIPGASYGYYIWEEDEEIHISWSVDRKDTVFSGSIETDGTIESFELLDWEETDIVNTGEGKISYSSTLGVEDFTDGIYLK